MASRLHFDVEVGTVELSLFLRLLIFLGIFRLFMFGLLFLSFYVLVENQRHKVKASYEKMEPKAVELLDVLRNMNLAIDAKVSLLNSMKSDINQKCVPENAIAPIWKHLAPCAEQTQVRALDIESEDNQKTPSNNAVL
ncbi:uncharacterized protein BO88DRAFT_420519 [Aspergillus vadensis CBS 113365]|uniref:Uncharacterized protein n=1 Tax=Aspergillus vadensis (strain CBS 113365 / IMI 142717 / IBT 24658) TaxID=1448311 RepID=A0A319ASE5_ASPVC|nr:hypothetical protein BO88DRAFT_420519 [Aspergillus vadensis CBS 113365]PYH63236.1 hypothetical protein BO88DRAFT_420519 [Aspergillus vadensis CBS 113365]